MTPIEKYLARARVAYQETGLTGLMRRTARVGLVKAQEKLGDIETALYYQEARARLDSETRIAAEATARMKDSLRGRRAFILATGPSLKEIDLNPLGSEITFGLNSFYLHPIVNKWKPTYLAMMDYAIFMNGSTADEFFQSMRAALPTSEFFVPAQFCTEIRTREWLPIDRVHGVAMDGDFCNRNWDIIDPTMLPSTPNVLMFALAMAIYLGCSPIVLLGADNNWLARPKKAHHPLTHFYEESQLKFRIEKATARIDFTDYKFVIDYCARLWRGYKNLRRIAEKNGQLVINASPGSYLDVFPQVALDDILRGQIVDKPDSV